MSSRRSRKYSRRSFMVAPGTVPIPPVITRVGMPSVCESTACRTSLLRMIPLPLGEPGRDGLLGGGPDRGLLLGQQRHARRPYGTAVPSDDVHGQLDRLHEL